MAPAAAVVADLLMVRRVVARAKALSSRSPSGLSSLMMAEEGTRLETTLCARWSGT